MLMFYLALIVFHFNFLLKKIPFFNQNNKSHYCCYLLPLDRTIKPSISTLLYDPFYTWKFKFVGRIKKFKLIAAAPVAKQPEIIKYKRSKIKLKLAKFDVSMLLELDGVEFMNKSNSSITVIYENKSGFFTGFLELGFV